MDLLNLSLYFIIFSIIGWCLDTFMRCVRRKRWAPSRNFPFLPMYGIGSLLILWSPPILREINPIVQFLIFGFVFCFYEWIAGVAILRFLGKRLWDYRERDFNLAGHTDLFHFFIWGMVGVITINWVDPAVRAWMGDLAPTPLL
ncbi:MAG: putative ABC transporter permease [Verrucomicrobiota bacterium]